MILCQYYTLSENGGSVYDRKFKYGEYLNVASNPTSLILTLGNDSDVTLTTTTLTYVTFNTICSVNFLSHPSQVIKPELFSYRQNDKHLIEYLNEHFALVAPIIAGYTTGGLPGNVCSAGKLTQSVTGSTNENSSRQFQVSDGLFLRPGSSASLTFNKCQLIAAIKLLCFGYKDWTYT